MDLGSLINLFAFDSPTAWCDFDILLALAVAILWRLTCWPTRCRAAQRAADSAPPKEKAALQARAEQLKQRANVLKALLLALVGAAVGLFFPEPWSLYISQLPLLAFLLNPNRVATALGRHDLVKK